MNYKTCNETIKTIHSNLGELFILSEGKRKKLAECRVDIDIIRHSTVYRARNPTGYNVYERYASIVFCLEPKAADKIDNKVFETAEGYEVYFEVEKNIGEYEKIKLDNLLEESIDLFENEWIFRIEDEGTVRKLMKI